MSYIYKTNLRDIVFCSLVSNFCLQIYILQKIQHFSKQLGLSSILKVLNTFWHFNQSRMYLHVELKILIIISTLQE